MYFLIEYFGVANISSIQEVEKVKPTAQRDDSNIQTPIEISITLLILQVFLRDFIVFDEAVWLCLYVENISCEPVRG